MINLNQSEQLRRVVTIDQVLRAKQRPTLKRIQNALAAAKQAFSRRSVQRDLDYMKTDLEAPIDKPQVSNIDRDGVREYYYRYTDPSWQLEDIVIDKDDILAMNLAREMLRHTLGVPGAETLKKTYDKLLGLADDNVRIATNQTAPIAFAGGLNAPVNPTVWYTVLQAIREKKTLRMTYNSGWKKPAKPSRVIEPYYIVNLAGDWYLLGTAGLTDPNIRQYKMSRISSPIKTKASFTMPADFNIDHYLENVFGRYVGDPKTLITIKIQFAKRIASLVMDHQFHRKEKKITLKNDDIVVEFPVSAAGPWPYYHVISWILSWGSDAKVLAPAELKKLVAEECRKMVENH